MSELRFEKEFTIPGSKPATAACVIPSYKGLPLQREAIVLGPREVELEVQRKCIYYATYQTVDDSAGRGDIVNIDFQGYLNGQPFDDGKVEGFDLQLGSNTFVSGFEDQIMGHSAGETFTISVTFPEEYPAEELKGQEATFTITVNEVKHFTVPEASDEIAHKEGYADLAAMSEAIRLHRVELHRARQDEKLQESLLNQLIDATQVEIPTPLKAFTVRQLSQQLERKLAASKTTRKQYLSRSRMSEEELSQQLQERATNAITKQLVVAAITQQEQLTPTNQEVDTALEEYLKNAPKRGRQNNTSLKALMKERICCHKVSAFLLQHAVEEA